MRSGRLLVWHFSATVLLGSSSGQCNFTHPLRSTEACPDFKADRTAKTAAECKANCCADLECGAYQWSDADLDEGCFRGSRNAKCRDDPGQTLWVGEGDGTWIVGCTNRAAVNFNPQAEQDDGSCRYGNDPSVCNKSTGLDGTTAVRVALTDCARDFSFSIGEWPALKGPFTSFGRNATSMVLCMDYKQRAPLTIHPCPPSCHSGGGATLSITSKKTRKNPYACARLGF